MKLSQRELAIIVEKCKKQDRLSQRKVYELFYSKMMAICLRYAKNEDEAFDKFQDMMVGKTDYITPTVRVIKDLNYEAYTGIKPEGTD